MKKESSATKRINLKNHIDFINIEGRYGAYQDWLYTEKIRTKFFANRACGVVAAGNVAYYLTQNHNKKLYDHGSLNIKNFTRHLNDISNFIRPRIYGIPTVYKMKKGFISFAKSKNIDIEAKTIKMNKPKGEIIEFIKNALREDYPLMMVTWNSETRRLKNHWITITGYSIDKNGNSFIKTSNWGRCESFSLDKWLDSRSLYKGLVYFK